MELLMAKLLLGLCFIQLFMSRVEMVQEEKPIVVLTIKSPDGDIIDCIHRREQPAFDHPLLQNHTIQDAPKRLPKVINKREEKRVWQVWNQNGTKCPDQTVPIRRTTVGTKPYRKKHWSTHVRLNHPTVPYTADQGHEYAIGGTGYLRGIYGTQATMNIWSPTVEPGADEFSLSQIWLYAGQFDNSDLNTVEAGWQSDSYQYTGCLNLECPGFVQVSTDFVIGGAFFPTSSYGSNQYDITMSIWKDTEDGNWWLGIGQSFIGYWPAKLFTHLSDGPATVVQWGGEVVNTRIYGKHTTYHTNGLRPFRGGRLWQGEFLPKHSYHRLPLRIATSPRLYPGGSKLYLLHCEEGLHRRLGNPFLLWRSRTQRLMSLISFLFYSKLVM